MKSSSSTEFRVGERVPGTDWVMRGIVGQGGMGIVLEVRKGRNLRAAMKVLRPAIARSAEFESRFAEEVEVMARLRHPNIVEVYDCGVLADGSPFLLMELLTGRTIRAVARDKAMRFTAESVWRIAGQICAGLAYAHNDKPPVVHRDVKPENVFLHGRRNVDSRVKLLDFGIAKVLDQTRAADDVAGTPRYMAPEVLRKEPLSAQVDLYALAVLVYELLTQGYPWPVNVRSAGAVSEAHLKLEPMPPSRWKAWIPRSVDECLLQALSKDPRARQRTVAEFYEQLAELEIVDDGSAKYRTDAPTVPTVETMARGGNAAVTDAHLHAQAAKPGVAAAAAAGGWLQVARSRLAEEVLSFDVSSDTASAHGAGRLTGPHERPGDAPASAASRAKDSATAEPAARVDTPMTGSGAPRAETRIRVSPAALVLSVGVLLVAGSWGGWRAWHGAAPRGPSPGPVLPAQLAPEPAPTVHGSEAPPAPLAGPAQESAALDAGSAPDGGPGQALAVESASAVRRAAVPPARSMVGRPARPLANLDDVIFGMDDTPTRGAAPRGADLAVGTKATLGASSREPFGVAAPNSNHDPGARGAPSTP